jgi:hypothetical protein
MSARVALNGRRWWKNSAMGIHIALPNRYFDELGVPPGPEHLNPQ